MTTSSNSDLSTDQTWIMVNKHSHKNTSLDSLPFKKEPAGRPSKAPQHNQFSIVLDEELHPHDSKALMKCAEVLMLLVRDAAHITPYNFDSCVHSIRVFVEASMQNVSVPKRKLSHGKQKDKKQRNKRENKSSG
ncbi:GBF1 [Bugula neritina]|uniref:GBF1 n=1 Tax=Bugula neritina TaxID=10212 RepID=A0A7J7KD34_BUGNE|nr:GBF1 [Bugula neritina]